MSVTDFLGLPSWLDPVFNNGWVVALAWALLLTPMGVILMALIFEKRLPPILKNAFRSFLPGDVCLGITLAASVATLMVSALPNIGWQRSAWFNVMAWFAAACVFAIGRMIDRGGYTKKQLLSPSKLYHDVVLYLGYGWLMFRVVVPAVYVGYVDKEANVSELIAILAFVAWLGMLVLDGTRSKQVQALMRQKAHPERGWCFCLSSGSFMNDAA